MRPKRLSFTEGVGAGFSTAIYLIIVGFLSVLIVYTAFVELDKIEFQVTFVAIGLSIFIAGIIGAIHKVIIDSITYALSAFYLQLEDLPRGEGTGRPDKKKEKVTVKEKRGKKDSVTSFGDLVFGEGSNKKLILIHCKNCNNRFRIPELYSGVVFCPDCKSRIFWDKWAKQWLADAESGDAESE